MTSSWQVVTRCHLPTRAELAGLLGGVDEGALPDLEAVGVDPDEQAVRATKTQQSSDNLRTYRPQPFGAH